MNPKSKQITIECTCNQYQDVETPCCEALKRNINDCENHLYYSRKYRQYAICRVGTTSITCIDYCPWCGIKMPKSLEDQWDEILEKEYGIVITEPWNKKQLSQIPDEFNSDEWWKKRGL
jgi:hypothetical protein